MADTAKKTDAEKNEAEIKGEEKKSLKDYSHLGAAVAACVVLYILYMVYNNFMTNQCAVEEFTEKTIKTGVDDDKVFDVEGEINKLRELQEKYLRVLKRD